MFQVVQQCTHSHLLLSINLIFRSVWFTFLLQDVIYNITTIEELLLLILLFFFIIIGIIHSTEMV